MNSSPDRAIPAVQSAFTVAVRTLLVVTEESLPRGDTMAIRFAVVAEGVTE